MNKKILITIYTLCVTLILLISYLWHAKLSQAAPSQLVDATNILATAKPSQRKVVRTTYGTNNNRVFAIAYDGSTQYLYYSDDADAASPTWNSVSFATGMTSADMIWDESNDVLYLAYGFTNPANSNAADITYKQVTNLGSTPTVGTARIALNGNSGSTTYHHPQIQIAQDSGTTKVFVFGSRATGSGSPSGWDVAVGTINSDNPTWTTYNAKSWTASAASGLMGVSRTNTDKLTVFYYDGTNLLATRHDDNSSATASSGWDALDGTDNSQTTISADDPNSRNFGSVIGMPNSNAVWFAWQDSSYDLNTIRWNGTGLDTEMVPVAFSSDIFGPALASDGVTVWLVYRYNSDNTQLVAQTRSATDGTTSWSGNVTILDDTTENVVHPSVSYKIHQGKLDIVYTTQTSYLVRHASSYKVSGNIYQESASSPYEGSTVWSGCDDSTLNVAVSINGGTKQNTWCSSSNGSFYFVLPQPTASDQDITVFLDTGGGNKAALFTHNNNTNTDITNLTLYKDKVVIRSESSSSITNADINTYDQTSDSDIPIASDGTNATLDSGFELHINSGETYAPGGNVTTSKLHLKGTYIGGSETITFNGTGSSSSCDDTVTNLRPFCLDSGTFTPNSNTTLFSGAGNALIQNTTYNTLRIEPSANSAIHTLMAGTTTAGGNLTFGNGTNTDVTITAATNNTTLTANANLTISSNTTFSANGTNLTSVVGNWSNSGSFTHNSGTVSLAGSDGSTQTLSGNTTFYNLTASTVSNTLGRTLAFTGNTTTTVAGVWTITGFSGKVLTLQSTDTNNWTITPTTANVDYATISRSTSNLSICATHSTDGGNNNANWSFTSGSSCNSAPNTPSLDSPTDSATNQSLTLSFLTTATDSDSDYLRYKIELCENVGMSTNCQTFDQTVSQTGWSGQNTQTSTAYTSGTQAAYTLQSTLSNNFTYYWRSYAIDPGGTNTWSSTQGSPYSFTTILDSNATLYLNGINLNSVIIN